MIGIGELSSAISLTKDGFSLANYFRKMGLAYFSKKSLPLDKFNGQEVVIVCSSLFAPHNDKASGYYSLVKPMKNEGAEWREVPVGSGYNVTGIYDVLGLNKTSIALIRRKCLISVTIDPLDDSIKKENLCLIGGRVSNSVSRELYDDFIPLKFHFYGSQGGMTVHGINMHGGGYGHILLMKNPWNKDKRVLWVAGLGPLGTGAAIDFLINSFQEEAPSELFHKTEWILFIKGVAKDGSIVRVNQIGHHVVS